MRLSLQIKGNKSPNAAGIFLSPNFINCKLNKILLGAVSFIALITVRIFR